MMSISVWITIGIILAAVWLWSCPLFFCRLITRLLRMTIIRARVSGAGRIPQQGGALLVANHVAFFDALMILASTPRPVRFMVHENFFHYFSLRCFFRWVGVLKVPSALHAKAMQAFVEDVRNRLKAGEVICIFPEGGISDNGLLQQFHDRIGEFLPSDGKVPLIPIRLGMMWGRLFTMHRGRLRFIPLRRLPIWVEVTVGERISPDSDGFAVRQKISEMGAEAEMKPFPGELPIHAEFARRVRYMPFHKTFRDFGSAPLSDFSLLVRSLILSQLIRKLDAKNPSGGYIGVLLPNCTTSIATIFGVLFADRTPAVLNYTAGTETLAKAARKADLHVILTSRKFLEKLNFEPLPEMICLEDVAAQVTSGMKFRTALDAILLPWQLLIRKYAPLGGRDLDRTAVLLFSSGSTGDPKGVMLNHRNINSNILSFWRGINWSAEDRVIGSLPLFHAFGFTVCLAFPALSGTQAVYLPNILDGAAVAKLIREHRITLMITTPTFLQNYMRKAKKEDLASLRLVITGAEKLRSDIAENFREMTGLSIVEGYGCTELSPIVCVNLASSFFDLGRKAGAPDSVGVPMPGIHVKIVDPETGAALPPDTPGMLLVKGALVMAGYLKDEAGTKQVIDSEGYYRTGDIAAMSRTGHITITGRLSRFSKIAGEMVPHELVERALAELLKSDERSVAVTGAPDPKRGEKLVVFYTDKTLDAEEMIGRLREMGLPNLWIPKREDFRWIERLPLLGSGKLDVQHLKKLAEHSQEE